jgi:hypothetical protein
VETCCEDACERTPRICWLAGRAMVVAVVVVVVVVMLEERELSA